MADTIIPNVVVSMPSQLFTLARAFKAAANGRIYIGKIDTDPTIPENQIQVYLENEDGTHVPIAQPININSGGYPVYGGQIAKLVTVQGHSMAVYDAYGAQQFYFPNVLKYDPDQLRQELSGADGYKLIGRCPDVDTLRTIAPTKPGQMINMISYYSDGTGVGGGFLESSLDSTTLDDGGMFFRVNGQWGWKRVKGAVNLGYYGIKLQNKSSVSFTDYTKKFQSMINYCATNNVPLVSDNTQVGSKMYSDYGIYITSPVDLTGLRELHGNITIFLNGVSFSDINNVGVAVRADNAEFDGSGRYMPGTTSGNLNWTGSLEVVNLTARSGSIQGLRATFTRSKIGRLKAYGFVGRGVHLACCYDSHIDLIEAERCGDITRYGVEISTFEKMAGADESNALTIGGLMAHDCTEKGWWCAGSKMRLIRVHEEGTIVTQNPINPTPLETRTTYGRMNSYFSSVGGGIGNVSVDPLSTNQLSHVFAFGAVDSSAATLGSPRATVVLMSGDPGPFGGSVGAVYSQALRIVANARCTVNRVEVTNEFVGGDTSSCVLGGFLTNITNNICRISNVTVRNGFSIQPLQSSTYTACTFNGVPCFNGIRTYLQNCTILADLIVDSNYRAEFSDTRIQSVNITGLNVDITLSNVNIPGNFNIDGAATGVWLLNRVRIDGSKSAWRLPTAAPWIGARTSNPDPRPGEGVDFTFTGGGWVQLTLRVS